MLNVLSGVKASGLDIFDREVRYFFNMPIRSEDGCFVGYPERVRSNIITDPGR